MEGQKTIYIADDEKNIREAIQTFLNAEGFRVKAFGNGEDLLSAFAEEPCDLVILDVMMPGCSGFDVCSRLREVSTVPVIMLTARDSDIDYATGLSLGSDDYFTKPFSAMSLIMRIKAIFRRIEFEHQSLKKEDDSELMFGDITMRPKSKMVTCKGQSLELMPNEFTLLHYLMEHAGSAVSRDELLNTIWGYDTDVETRVADDTVRRLRKKLLGSDVTVETVWGFGFILKEGADEA